MNRSNKITVIIPCKRDSTADITLNSLDLQTYQNFDLVVVPDKGKGANWARNEGFKQCNTEYVLFSDNDIQWKSHGIGSLLYALERHPKASYSYGRFELGGVVVGHQLFDPVQLLKRNYISTMSLIRSKDFPGFDEKIKRFQDWDLWITMLKQGKRGVYCNDLIFTTEVKKGISYQNSFTELDALKVLNDKHNLQLPQFSDKFVL